MARRVIRRKYRKTKVSHTLGKRRERSGISRLALASYLGMNYSTLWRWETGTVTPPTYGLAFWREGLRKMKAQKKAGADR